MKQKKLYDLVLGASFDFVIMLFYSNGSHEVIRSHYSYDLSVKGKNLMESVFYLLLFNVLTVRWVITYVAIDCEDTLVHNEIVRFLEREQNLKLYMVGDANPTQCNDESYSH